MEEGYKKSVLAFALGALFFGSGLRVILHVIYVCLVIAGFCLGHYWR